MPEQMTLGLLGERLSRVQTSVDSIQNDMKVVTDQALNLRLTKLEDSVRWLTRTVVASLVGGVGSALFAVVVR